jgi:DNA-binding winged helix-turn-helix (wHTH) protein
VPDNLAFASFHLQADGTLFRGEQIVHLPPKELQALRLLLEQAGSVVSPTQLRDELWGDTHVTADSVPRCISSLRSLLEPDDCIQTIYKRGYRLKAPVRRDGSRFGLPPERLAIVPFQTGLDVPAYLGLSVVEEAMTCLTEAAGRHDSGPRLGLPSQPARLKR